MTLCMYTTSNITMPVQTLSALRIVGAKWDLSRSAGWPFAVSCEENAGIGEVPALDAGRARRPPYSLLLCTLHAPSQESTTEES
ncbi:hypothetical protein PUN28_020774 [Cardiocondyla obscurior]|uniref:Uncharacterized protein n=1 Tax=Cardiocondyla obscurior TaxID=286306 RepID=A0AAW2E577_9HYME